MMFQPERFWAASQKSRNGQK